MIDFDLHDRKRDLEAGALLIVVCVLGFLALFAFIVVQLYKFATGV